MDTQFLGTASVLPVADVSRALEFYERVFGFTRGHLADDPPVYATMSRDGVDLHLTKDRAGDLAGRGNCCIFVRGVDELYQHCLDEGVEIDRHLEDSPYGLRDFNARDLDGNLILFGQSSQ